VDPLIKLAKEFHLFLHKFPLIIDVMPFLVTHSPSSSNNTQMNHKDLEAELQDYLCEYKLQAPIIEPISHYEGETTIYARLFCVYSFFFYCAFYCVYYCSVLWDNVDGD
jgi:hypothetical protein